MPLQRLRAFDAWFEPTADVPYTLDLLIAGVSEYIATFKRAYAVTMEYNPSRFRTEVLRAESSRAVKRLFLDLVQDVSCAFASIDNRSNYIDAIIGYIERNYADPKLNIDALADHVGLSASHIQNIFKAATGSSISAYLRRLRLNKATEFWRRPTCRSVKLQNEPASEIPTISTPYLSATTQLRRVNIAQTV